MFKPNPAAKNSKKDYGKVAVEALKRRKDA